MIKYLLYLILVIWVLKTYNLNKFNNFLYASISIILGIIIINWLFPDKNTNVEKFTDLEIDALTPEQIGNLTPEEVATLTIDQINKLGLRLINLKVKQLTLLSYDKFTAITGNTKPIFEQNKSLMETPLNLTAVPTKFPMGSTISDDLVAKLTPDEIYGLPSGILSQLSSSVIQNLTKEQITAISPDRINELQLSILSPSQISALRIKQISALSLDRINELSLPQLSMLSPLQVSGLNEKQIENLGPNLLNFTLNQLSINNDKDVNLIIKYLVEKKIIKIPTQGLTPGPTPGPTPGIVMKLRALKTERDTCISDLKEIKNILSNTLETIINDSQLKITELNNNIANREYIILNINRIAPPANISANISIQAIQEFRLSKIISEISQLVTDKEKCENLKITLGPYSNNTDVAQLLETLNTINNNLGIQKLKLDELYIQYTQITNKTSIPPGSDLNTIINNAQNKINILKPEGQRLMNETSMIDGYDKMPNLYSKELILRDYILPIMLRITSQINESQNLITQLNPYYNDNRVISLINELTSIKQNAIGFQLSMNKLILLYRSTPINTTKPR